MQTLLEEKRLNWFISLCEIVSTLSQLTMRKPSYLSLMGLLLCCSIASARTSPNVILFLVDDMGLMDTSVPMLADRNAIRSTTGIAPRTWNGWPSRGFDSHHPLQILFFHIKFQFKLLSVFAVIGTVIFGEAEGLGQGVFEVEAGVMPRNSAASPTAQPFFFRRVCSRLFQLVADEAGAVGGDSLEAGGDELAGLGGGVDGPGVEA
jgi:hypothetical protein